MPVLVVIPARLGSTRLPRKPLQPLGGVPLIVRVAERVRGLGIGERSLIATDSEEIASAVRAAGFEAVLTASGHRTGTDRVHEASSRIEFSSYEEILNVQGDEPFVSAGAMAGALAQLRKGCDLGTAAVPLDPQEAGDHSKVKVVTDGAGRALYFSRSVIPARGGSPSPGAPGAKPAYWQHLGVYAYSRVALRRVASAPPSPLELAEGLEQLRALELGLSIGVELLEEPALPAIDTIEDLREAEELWTVTHEVSR